MTTPSIRASQSNFANAGTSVVVTAPTNVNGDRMLAFVQWRGTAITVTPPAGWTLLRDDTVTDGTTSRDLRLRVYHRTAAAEPGSYTWTFSGTTNASVVVLACQDTAIPSVFGANTANAATTTIPSVTIPHTNAVLLQVMARTNTGTGAAVTPSGFTLTQDPSASMGNDGVTVFHKTGMAAGASGTSAASFTGGTPFDIEGLHVVLASSNTAPNTGTPTYPISGVTIDRTITNRFTHTFSDPDVGDTLSKTDYRYRLLGAGSWTTVTDATPNAYHDFASGTFAAGDYEWQVLPYDALGTPAASWSSSAFFTAANPPSAPTITAPINNATISTSTGTLTISAPSLDSWQWRKVADSAGSPDTATVYDSGTESVPTSRLAPLTYPTNNRYEHLQARINIAGLWSSWASIRVQVAYTPPATPTAVVTPGSASIVIGSTHPTPTGSQPAVTSFNVHRRLVGDTGIGIRRAVGVTPAGTFQENRIVSRSLYEFRTEDVGANGTTSFSAWTA
jgi:hypothetical protein